MSRFTLKTLLPAMAIGVMFSTLTTAGDEALKMQTFKGAINMELNSMNVDGVNAYLSDIVSSNDPDAPISCGLFRMEKGDALEYTYTYDEVKIIIDGEMTISEENGESFNAVAGDVIYFDKGAKITFTSNSSGLGFVCGQRPLDEL